jgi:hypothetical protein
MSAKHDKALQEWGEALGCKVSLRSRDEDRERARKHLGPSDGPWQAHAPGELGPEDEEFADCEAFIISREHPRRPGDRQKVASVHPLPGTYRHETEATAALIADAPNLHAEIARLRSELERLLGPMGPLQRIAMVHPECAAFGDCQGLSHDWSGCVYCHVRSALRGSRHDA